VHLFEPHEPYEPPPELVREDSNRGRYDGEVRLADRAIGELVRTFRAQKPGATVIVTADHGEEFGEHGGSYHGTTLYEEQVRIPLVWSSPGATRPALVDTPVELTDIGTSLLSAAGIPREARMRGDDLGAVLAGHADAGPRFAFASVEASHMATDGRFKAVCAADVPHCSLFDLVADPSERRNLATDRPADVARLRAELDGFFAAIPRAEALGVADGIRFPEPLARAKLGAPGAGPDVIPLLADARAPVRAASARVLGELHVASALTMLDRLRDHDPDPTVRAEAAIAALTLGTHGAAGSVMGLLDDANEEPEALDRARRAALALGRLRRVEAEPVLAKLALDERAQESERERAVEALGALQTPSAAGPLIALLEDVRLRPAAATALGELGGKRAKNALAKQLAVERYPSARTAEARAMVRLRDRRARGLILRLLGMETSLPDGVRMLMELRALSPSSGRGALVQDAGVRQGRWTCEGGGCRPDEQALLVLPARGRVPGTVRVTWLVHAGGEASELVVDGVRFVLKPGEQQLSFTRSSAAAGRFGVSCEGDVSVLAVVVTPAREEMPPPPPEPWQAEDAGGVAPAAPLAPSPG
jgi:hypothetical protein